MDHAATMNEVHRIVSRAAKTRSTVLITGETGVGKERVARAIHDLATEGPWIAVNCGALPEELAESLLFGHQRGAFTGANRSQRGKLLEANGGTLFLDEVGELPLPLQVKLLRVLQERTVEPLGGSPVPVELRVVAATNRDLTSEVSAGRFREDLYYRLAVLTIEVPPLRARRQEIPELIRDLTARLCERLDRPEPRIAHELVTYLQGCRWPGNVRQLENVLESSLVLSEGHLLGLSSLPRSFRKESFFEAFEPPPTASAALPPPAPAILKTSPEPTPPVAGSSPVQHLKPQVDAFEKRLLVEALAASAGRKKDAAQALGISPRAMSYYLRKHEM